VCDLETSRIGAPYIYDISNLRVKPPKITFVFLIRWVTLGTYIYMNAVAKSVYVTVIL
jgi:hypothetical protein